MKEAQSLKRIQSRVLIQELSAEALDLVSGGDCESVDTRRCDANGSCTTTTDLECHF